MNGHETKRFYAAVEDQISQPTFYNLKEEARRYMHGEVQKRSKLNRQVSVKTIL